MESREDFFRVIEGMIDSLGFGVSWFGFWFKVLFIFFVFSLIYFF